MPVPRITKEDLSTQLESAAPPCLVDVRLKYPYEHSTVKLPGAVRIEPSVLDLSPLPRDRKIVAYDSDPKELVSARVVAHLLREGYEASALEGGISEWLAPKLPTEEKEAPKQAPPKAGALG